MVTREEIIEVLSYDTKTGDFHWKNNRSTSVRKGDKAGTVWHYNENLSYIFVWINGGQHRAHRLAFLIMEGRWPKYIDHINGIGTDNRWENLREVTKQGNAKNQRLSKANKSGQTGVCFHNKHKLWLAYINVDYKRIHLGWYKNYDDAVKTRKESEIEHDFHKNHGEKR